MKPLPSDVTIDYNKGWEETVAGEGTSYDKN